MILTDSLDLSGAAPEEPNFPSQQHYTFYKQQIKVGKPVVSLN